MSVRKKGLVVSAHAADFVWRAGGAIALYANRGWDVTVVCLSYGERGESQKLWADPTMTLPRVKEARRGEATAAAEILGCTDIRFLDMGDYPMRTTAEDLKKMADIYQEIRPEWVLTHSLDDPYNFDHPTASHFAQEARVVAQAHGHHGAKAAIKAPPVFLFEPHQPEHCNWTPQLILNITEVWPTKLRAFQSMGAQEHLWEYYTRVAMQRGAQSAHNSAAPMKYGEAYQRVFPTVTEEFL